MRAVVLLNPRSGAASLLAPAALADRFAAVGVEAEMVPFGPDLAATVREASDRADVVVAGGGDGTICAVAEGLAGSGVPLGVLPLGTFNHFARGLGLPTPLDDAVRVIAEGSARVVSGGRINGRLFLNNVALGLAPEVVVQRHESHGSRATRAALTAPVALRALRRMDRLHLAGDLDGRAVALATPFVFVTPNDYEPHLFRFAVRERRADGRLYVYLATPDGPADALRVAFHVLRGHLDRHLDVSVASRLALSSKRPAVRVLMDGEVSRLPSPLVIEGVREAVRVILPNDGEGEP